MIDNKGCFDGFVTDKFIYSSNNPSELVCVLTFMDLKYETEKIVIKENTEEYKLPENI